MKPTENSALNKFCEKISRVMNFYGSKLHVVFLSFYRILFEEATKSLHGGLKKIIV